MKDKDCTSFAKEERRIQGIRQTRVTVAPGKRLKQVVKQPVYKHLIIKDKEQPILSCQKPFSSSQYNVLLG